jgi:hypothetical protein
MLLEQDIPTNYEEKMVDLNARNDLEHEILWIKHVP